MRRFFSNLQSRAAAWGSQDYSVFHCLSQNKNRRGRAVEESLVSGGGGWDFAAGPVVVVFVVVYMRPSGPINFVVTVVTVDPRGRDGSVGFAGLVAAAPCSVPSCGGFENRRNRPPGDSAGTSSTCRESDPPRGEMTLTP
jgi:hypothetical protein